MQTITTQGKSTMIVTGTKYYGRFVMGKEREDAF